MKEEEGRRIAAVDAFHMAEKSIHDLKSKLTKEERERKSAAAALKNVENQVKGQWVLLRNVKDQLAASKEQISALKKKLKEVQKAKDQVEKTKEEVEKARDKADQQGYDIGVVETEGPLRAEVSGLCRNYYSQVWHEALNQARFEASSILRKPESVYYPLAIRASRPSNSSTNTAPEVAEASKDSPAKVLTSSDKPSEVTKHPRATEKEKNANQGVAPDATKPSAAIQDPPTKKEVPNKMEIVLATLPLPTKVDPASKGPKALEATSSQPNKAPPQGKIVIKKK